MQIILEQSPWHAFDATLQQLKQLTGGQYQTFQHPHPGWLEFFVPPQIQLCTETVQALPCVQHIYPTQTNHPIIERKSDHQTSGFCYQDLKFSQDTFHLFAGLNAVDTPVVVESVMKQLQSLGLVCARMGAYKPRTSPYSFQGLGQECLAPVFELAGTYGIRVIAMEVTHERHIEEIDQVLTNLGSPTGVMLQVGTRNAQNYELLKALGQQHKYPILYKRGFGVSLEESLNAAEYIAAHGNRDILFCLRGMKSHVHEDHRNFADLGQIPVIRRNTCLPVGFDPSHSVGHRFTDVHGISDIHQLSAQAVVSGVNMLLVDVHPTPEKALVDAKQALNMQELARLVEDIQLCRDTWQQRLRLYQKENSTA